MEILPGTISESHALEIFQMLQFYCTSSGRIGSNNVPEIFMRVATDVAFAGAAPDGRQWSDRLNT